MRNDLVNLLRPYTIFDKKIRLGSPNDGGYVLNETLLNNSDILYSYGVEYNCDFELDFNKLTSKEVYLFDHTVDSIIEQHGLFFKKEGLSHIDEDTKKRFETHIVENNHLDKQILLKIDIEGGEYEFFETLDYEKIKPIVTGFIIEFHNTGELNNFRPRFIKILEKITSHYTLTHVHGNNCSSLVSSWFTPIPWGIELTFVRDNMFPHFKFDTGPYPTELDSPNNPDFVDLPLSWIC